MGNFTSYFQDLEDPRHGNAGQHDLLEILMIALCTTLCGGKSTVDMELFGQSKEVLLRQFLTLERGIPSHDTFSRVFRLLDPVVNGWVRRNTEAAMGNLRRVIDG